MTEENPHLDNIQSRRVVVGGNSPTAPYQRLDMNVESEDDEAGGQLLQYHHHPGGHPHGT